MINLINVKKSFARQKAVNGLTFKIRKGEVVGLLGPNGAGKTTTMRMLVGYLFPDHGKITIDGLDITENAQKLKKDIGYMPENNPIYKDMLVEESLKFSLNFNNVPKNRWPKLIQKVVKITQIGEVYYNLIDELSKGFKQRVGLAQALIHDPKILILDEPTEGLDPNQRNEIRKLIKEIGQEKTVIISTHVMQEVTAMCDRVIIINHGKMVVDAKPDELMNKKSNKIYLKAKGEDIMKNIKNFEEVEKIKLLKKINDSKKYLIYYNGQKSFYKKLSQEVGKNNWVIFELREERISLEEIFYQVTKDK